MGSLQVVGCGGVSESDYRSEVYPDLLVLERRVMMPQARAATVSGGKHGWRSTFVPA